MSKRFFVYIMTNNPRHHVLYIGVSGSLVRRIFEHKNMLIPGFTSPYNLTRLVYYEVFVYPHAAIEREKQFKGWLRRRKIELIESPNPHWHDVAEHWYNLHQPAAAVAELARSFTPPEKRLRSG